jgi:uncharacterized protein
MERISQQFDIFYGRDNNNYIIFFPLPGYLILANSVFFNLFQRIINMNDSGEIDPLGKINLKEKLFLKNDDKIVVPYQKKDAYLPTHIFLFPTLKCNLRCLYCYSDGGREKKDMEFYIARSAIDFAVSNALKSKKNEIKIYFHGGGEPTLNWNLFKESVNYAIDKSRKNNLKVKFGLATNGHISESKIDFIINNNFEIISIALDGNYEIQNLQRPGVAGADSFTKVIETCKYMDNKGFDNYDINVTVTDKNVTLLKDFIRYIGSHLKTKKVHLGPMVQAGRGTDSILQPPDLANDHIYFQEVLDEAQAYGIKVSIPGTDLHSIRYAYCGASTMNCFITYEGLISTCLESYDYNHPKGSSFIIGKINQDNSIEINTDKLGSLQKRTVFNLAHCKNCFLKYNCAGDCITRVNDDEDITTGSTSSDRCIFKKNIAKYKMKTMFVREIESDEETMNLQKYINDLFLQWSQNKNGIINNNCEEKPTIKKIIKLRRDKRIFEDTISICPGG